MPELVRTTRLKIKLPLSVAERTVRAWTDACNYISTAAFAYDCMSNHIKLHNLLYEEVRARFGLSSQITQSALRHVGGKYAAARTTRRTLTKPIHFKPQSVMLQGGPRGRDFAFLQSGLSIWTLDGRVKGLSFSGEPKLAEYLTSWNVGDARLCIVRGKVYLNVSFKTETPVIENPNDAVVGVDRGINYIATITDGRKAKFFGGGHTKDVRLRYNKRRASLQQNLAEHKKAHKDTRSLRRILKRQDGKESRFNRDTNHRVSKDIIKFAQATQNPTIAIEELGGIRESGRRLRKRQRASIGSWPFYQLEVFTRYKADTLGFAVVEIDPRNTSKGCSRCGYIADANRNRHNFTCHACGYKLHADLNAARNIRLRGIIARQDSGNGGLPSTSPEARESQTRRVNSRSCPLVVDYQELR